MFTIELDIFIVSLMPFFLTNLEDPVSHDICILSNGIISQVFVLQINFSKSFLITDTEHALFKLFILGSSKLSS